MRSGSWFGVAVLAVLTMAMPAEVSAQGVTTSGISGRIVDSSGQPVAAAQVVVVNAGTGLQSGALSGADGRYYVAHLEPGGPYTVEVQSIGFEAQRREGIRLALGQVFRANFTMSVQAVELEGFTVSVDPTFSGERTGQQTVVTDEQIAELPTLSRNFTELASLSPLVSTIGGNVGASVGGANNRFNNIQIDGAVNNDAFGLAASGVPGGQANGKPISQDAIAEFQVLVAPFDVRQSGFTGGLINAVTKSGRNELFGSFYSEYRNLSLVRDTLTVDGTDYAFNDFSNAAFGGTLGGPIVKDKAHFFISGEFERRNIPNSLGANSGAAALDLDQASINAVRDIAENQYGLDFGDITAYINENPALNLFGRLDFQLSPAHRLSLKHTYARADDDDSPRRGGGTFEPQSATYDFQNRTNTSVLQLFSSFGKWSNEVLTTVQFVRDQRAPAPEHQFSTVVVDVPTDAVNDGARIQFGAERFSHANRLDQDIFQFTNNLTGDFGAHRVTFGFNAERWSFDNLFLDTSLGLYEFDSVEDFQNGEASRYQLRASLGASVDDAAGVFAYNKFGVYAQDEFAVNDQLTLTYGLRVDVPVTSDKPRANPNFPGAFGFPTSEVPSGNPLVQPRLGFNYRFDTDTQTQLRGGAGIFAGRPAFVWIGNAFGNTGMESAFLQCDDGQEGVPAFNPTSPPQACPDGTSAATSAASIAVVDPDFKFPQELKFDLALDHEFGSGWRGTVEGIYTKSIDQIAVEELNGSVPTSESSAGLGIGSRTIYGTPQDSNDDPWRTTLVDGTNFREVVRMTNTSKGYSYALIGELEKSFEAGHALSGSYRYGRSYDIQSLLSSRAISNYGFNVIGESAALEDRPVTPSAFDVPHRVVARASTRLLEQYGGTNVSLIYRGQSGRTYSYVYDGDVNGDGFAGRFSSSRTNDLVYVPSSSSELAFRSADDERLFNELVALDPCLSDAQGSILERSGCRAPWQDQLDLRVTQGINAPNGRFEVVWDVFNVLNLLNSEWGIQEGPFNETVQLLRTRGRENDDPNGRVLFTYDGFRDTDANGNQSAELPYSVFSGSSRWQMKLGVRYVF